MSELKAVHAFDVYEAYTKTGDDDAAQVYLKSEADKVIADLEESHKMEVEQLLMEIVGLKKLVETADKLLRHQKYKRCLAQVENCRTSSVYFFNISERAKDEGKVAEYRRVSDWFDKWEERWLELAEKFKEAE